MISVSCREAGTDSVSNGCARGNEEEAGTSGQGRVQYTHLLCISPDAPTNPVLFWLGHFDAVKTRFLLEGAKGPLRLDLGDTLYAPNLMEDHQVGGIPSPGCLWSLNSTLVVSHVDQCAWQLCEWRLFMYKCGG